jgi:hypothetical protein
MGIGISILLIAAGAILRFAVHLHARVAGTSVDWYVIGDILMVVGAIGLVVALAWIAASSRRATTVVERRDRSVSP